MKLYELSDAYVSLLAQYDEAETEEERAAIIEAIQNVESDIMEKGANYARIIKNATAEANAYAEEIRRLTAKKRAAENVVSRLKENLLFAMGIAGANEIKTTIGKWSIQKNPPKVVVVDEAMIPACYLIEQQPEIDKRAILAAFKESGEIINGVDIVREDSVRFR